MTSRMQMSLQYANLPQTHFRHQLSRHETAVRSDMIQRYNIRRKHLSAVSKGLSKASGFYPVLISVGRCTRSMCYTIIWALVRRWPVTLSLFVWRHLQLRTHLG